MVSRIGGAASGAGAGALAGAPFGAPGAVIGGLGGALAGFLSPGTKDTMSQLPSLTPQQQQAQNQILSNLQGMGAPGGNYDLANQYYQGFLSNSPGAYEQFSSPYLQQFEQQIIPRLTERFSGLGGGLGGGIGNSSGFGQALGGASAQLSAQLAQMYQQLRNQAAGATYGQYNQLANQGLGTRAFENIYQPGTPGLGANALTGISQGYGQGFGQGAGYKFMQNKDLWGG